VNIIKILDRKKILDFMEMRKAELDDQIIRDFGGGLAGRVWEQREVKYWKEAIERGEFDTSIEIVYVVMHGYGEESRIVDFTFYTEVEKIRERVALLNELEKSEPDDKYWFMTMYSNLRNSKEDGELVPKNI
jgi:hypothetical protein